MSNLEKNYRSLQVQLNKCHLRSKHLYQEALLLRTIALSLILLNLWQAGRHLLP